MAVNHSTPKGYSAARWKGLFPGLTYVEGATAVHRLHPLVKLTLLISFSLAVFAVSSAEGGIFLFTLLLGAYRLADLGLSFFIRKLRFIFVFGLLIFLVQIIWVRQGYPLLHLDLGVLHLTIWSQGFWGGLQMMLRFVNVIGSSYLFVMTTNPNQLAYALMQAGLPYRAGFMLITALRFIPLFHLELAQIRNAQMAKGIELDGISFRRLLRVVKYLLVPLVISVLSKVDALTVSMESRAFGLHRTRSYMVSQVLSRWDRLAIVVIPLVFLLLVMLFDGILLFRAA